MESFPSVRSQAFMLYCKSLTDMGGRQVFKTHFLIFIVSPRGALWPHFFATLVAGVRFMGSIILNLLSRRSSLF